MIKAYDIDGVLANFIDGFIRMAKWNHADMWKEEWPDNYTQWDSWQAIPREDFSIFWKSYVEEDSFWRQLPLHPWIDGFQSKVDADFYITSRSVPSFVTAGWLQDNGFQNHNKVITVGVGQSKVDAIKDLGVTHMLEDAFHNFSDINENTDATCYIVARPHNIREIVSNRIPNDLIITNPNDYISL